MQYFSANDLRFSGAKVNPFPVVTVFDLDISNTTTSTAIQKILGGGRRKVAFVNAHCANVSMSESRYKAALDNADLLLPDGIGVELAVKMQGQTLLENLNGTDFVPKLLASAALRGLSVFLLGGTPGTAEAAAQRISTMIPTLQIAGTCNGFDEAKDATAKINASGADIVLVAMGVPTQELWIQENFDHLEVQCALAVGGLFDFWAGNVRRAPKLVRKARMEWAWRLAMEPQRLARRYLIGNFTFLARAGVQALQKRGLKDWIKRSIDVTLSGAALLALSPLLLLTAMAIQLESKGPAIYAQRRVGQDGKQFTLYKFRSMYSDSDKRRAALLATSDRQGVCFKSKTDPRITRVGKFIRRFSIDELPQIMNILRGDMSIVGPRPALPEEVALYSDHARLRLSAKPGLTGLWQVSGRADIGFEQMIEMDIAYVNSRSFILDSLLIALTFRTVFSGRGAY